jgi:putative flippase GtrA
MSTVNWFYIRIYRFINKKFPNFYRYCLKRKSLVKFLIAGTLAGSVDLIFLFIFHGLFGLGIVLATSLAFLLSFSVSFYLQKLWTFRNKEERKTSRQLVLYFLN